MPSSLLFAGLAATWLAVAVPMAARRRQPMMRPSDAALASRVLVRTGRKPRRGEEVSGTVNDTAGTRYRPGRGGYDPEAAVLAAQARATFRQRAVLVLVLTAVTTALVAVVLVVPEAWWVHGAADLLLVGYLVNLRRQVRSEQAIRARRAARLAGSRPAAAAARRRAQSGAQSGTPAATGSPAAGPPGRVLRRSGRRGRSAAGPPAATDVDAPTGQPDAGSDEDLGPAPTGTPDGLAPEDGPATAGADLGGERDAARSGAGASGADVAEPPALPPLAPVPLPPRPAGTVALELDAEDPELHELDPGQAWGYRRAAGQ